MTTKTIYLSLILCLLVCLPAKTAEADTQMPGKAIFYLALNKDTYFNPEIISFDLKINTASSIINALSAKLDFDAEKLTLIEADKTNSLCNFFISEEINNEAGHYELKCGSDSSLASEQIQAVHLTFKKNIAGTTVLNLLGESEALAANGLGTKLETIGEDYNIVIIK